MKRIITIAFAAALFPVAIFAANPENPKPVEVQGTVDVNVVSPSPLPVAVDGGLNVDSLPAIELAPDQSVNIAPGQKVEVPEIVFEPGDIIIRQSFIGTNSVDYELVNIPKTMILRTIQIIPSSIDTDPNLYNCAGTVRWPSSPNPLDPSSNDRYIVHHTWGGTNHIAFNYSMPYNVRLVQGSQLETSVGRVGSSGYCEALIILTGTKVP